MIKIVAWRICDRFNYSFMVGLDRVFRVAAICVTASIQ